MDHCEVRTNCDSSLLEDTDGVADTFEIVTIGATHHGLGSGVPGLEPIFQTLCHSTEECKGFGHVISQWFDFSTASTALTLIILSNSPGKDVSPVLLSVAGVGGR